MNTIPVIESFVWQPQFECLPQDELRALQARRLRETIARVAHVPFYREAFAKAKISPESIRTIDDIRRLPFTTKEDLRNHYPLGFLAVPRSEVVRYHGSSGTTGRPTFVAYTRKDLETWSDLTARFLTACGMTRDQTVQVSFGYGLFTGGFGLHYGIERVGAGVIPVGSGNTDKQLMILQDMAVDALICTPSYALKLAETMRERGLVGKLPLKFAQLGGEPWTEDMRVAIEKTGGFLCFNNYGLSEVMGPSVSGECAYRNGMHIQEDAFVFEVLDPKTLEPVPDGEYGEIVITALVKEAFSLIRYRTRDIGRIIPDGPCPCGRTTRRMSRIIGRSDDMLIIRGVNVYPSEVETALLRVEGATPNYQIEVTRPGALDQVTVRVEMSPEVFSDQMTDMLELKRRIHAAVQSVTGLSMNIELVSPKTLERFEGKAKRVIDRRNLNHE